MNKVETAKILTILTASYPRFNADEARLNIWSEMLEDIPYPAAQVAIKKLMATSIFPPSIAEIRKAALSLVEPEENLASEAWGIVSKAIRAHGYVTGMVVSRDESGGLALVPAENKAFSEMPPLVRKVVKQIGWRNICLSENMDVIRAQFMRMYQEQADKAATEKIYPQKLQITLSAIRKQIEGGKP